MRGKMKVLLLAGVLAAVAGACGQVDRLVTPDVGLPAADVAPTADGVGETLQHDAPPPPPPADTTGRWGGGLGSGT